MVTVLEMTAYKSLKDMTGEYLPETIEELDVSINVSHETNPIPTEVDVYPKSLNIDSGIYLLRCLISNK